MSVLNAPANGGTVRGTSANDLITGSGAADVLWGLGGDDIINGGDGNDVIEGDGSYNLVDAVRFSGNALVSNLGLASSSSKPFLTSMGALDATHSVWRISNTSDIAEIVRFESASNGKDEDGPYFYTIPAHSDFLVTSTNMSTHKLYFAEHGTDFKQVDVKAAGSQIFTSDQLVASGVDGNDVLSGGNGDDTIRGYGGHDILHGDAGNDALDGGTGNDLLDGGVGADKLIGGDGIDTADYSTSSANVNVNLASGVATSGDAEGDSFSSIENLNGSKFNDTLVGDAGNNVINGGAGDDMISGGAGADQLNGGDGIDTVTYANATSGVVLAFTQMDVHGIGSQYANLAAGGLVGDAQGDTYSGFENFIGTGFDDKIGGANAAMTYNLGAGNDVFDNVETQNNVDTVYGEAGNDTIWTGGGDDLVYGGAGNDALYGENGNDLLVGGEGNDLLDGGAGDDTLVGGAGADKLIGGDGIDTADYSKSTAAVNVNLEDGTGKGGDAESDTLTGIENLVGSAFNDILTGGNDVNVIYGGDGNDTITGGRADDKMFGGAGDDTFVVEWSHHGDYYDGGSGIDTFLADIPILDAYAQEIDLATGTNNWEDHFISIENIVGGANNDKFWGTDGENSFWGRGGNDLLDGRGGDDKLYGEAGDDTLIGGAGNDLLDGGVGNDILIGGPGADKIIGGDGVDVVDYSASGAGVNVNLTTGVGTGGDAEGDTITGVENLIGSKFDDHLTGDAGANSIRAGAGNDTVFGSAGVDFMDGGDGIDTLDYTNSNAGVNVNLSNGAASGGDAEGDTVRGFENLTGSKFDDVLAGDAGNNILRGGEGNDILFGSAGDGDDLRLDRLLFGGIGDEEAAVSVADVLNFLSGAYRRRNRMPTDVAAALNGNSASFDGDAQLFERQVIHEDDALSGRLGPKLGAARGVVSVYGFACCYPRG